MDIFHTDTCDMGLEEWENVKMVCEDWLEFTQVYESKVSLKSIMNALKTAVSIVVGF